MTAEEATAVQTWTPRGRTATGTGLGLAIVRSVAEALGGQLHIGTQSGRGTEVTLSVPVGPAGPKTSATVLAQ
jgi:signal transduction histidine kinase